MIIVRKGISRNFYEAVSQYLYTAEGKLQLWEITLDAARELIKNNNTVYAVDKNDPVLPFLSQALQTDLTKSIVPKATVGNTEDISLCVIYLPADPTGDEFRWICVQKV